MVTWPSTEPADTQAIEEESYRILRSRIDLDEDGNLPPVPDSQRTADQQERLSSPTAHGSRPTVFARGLVSP